MLVFGGEILLVNGHSMEFLSWGIICIPSWGINREKSSRAATMVSTYNTLEKQQHTTYTQTQSKSLNPNTPQLHSRNTPRPATSDEKQ